MVLVLGKIGVVGLFAAGIEGLAAQVDLRPAALAAVHVLLQRHRQAHTAQRDIIFSGRFIVAKGPVAVPAALQRGIERLVAVFQDTLGRVVGFLALRQLRGEVGIEECGGMFIIRNVHAVFIHAQAGIHLQNGGFALIVLAQIEGGIPLALFHHVQRQRPGILREVDAVHGGPEPVLVVARLLLRQLDGGPAKQRFGEILHLAPGFAAVCGALIIIIAVIQLLAIRPLEDAARLQIGQQVCVIHQHLSLRRGADALFPRGHRLQHRQGHGIGGAFRAVCGGKGQHLRAGGGWLILELGRGLRRLPAVIRNRIGQLALPAGKDLRQVHAVALAQIDGGLCCGADALAQGHIGLLLPLRLYHHPGIGRRIAGVVRAVVGIYAQQIVHARLQAGGIQCIGVAVFPDGLQRFPRHCAPVFPVQIDLQAGDGLGLILLALCHGLGIILQRLEHHAVAGRHGVCILIKAGKRAVLPEAPVGEHGQIDGIPIGQEDVIRRAAPAVAHQRIDMIAVIHQVLIMAPELLHVQRSRRSRNVKRQHIIFICRPVIEILHPTVAGRAENLDTALHDFLRGHVHVVHAQQVQIQVQRRGALHHRFAHIGAASVFRAVAVVVLQPLGLQVKIRHLHLQMVENRLVFVISHNGNTVVGDGDIDLDLRRRRLVIVVLAGTAAGCRLDDKSQRGRGAIAAGALGRHRGRIDARLRLGERQHPPVTSGLLHNLRVRAIISVVQGIRQRVTLGILEHGVQIHRLCLAGDQLHRILGRHRDVAPLRRQRTACHGEQHGPHQQRREHTAHEIVSHRMKPPDDKIFYGNRRRGGTG